MTRLPFLAFATVLATAACSEPQEASELGDLEAADTLDSSGLAFEGAHLQCFDGEVEIGIYADGGFSDESIYGMGGDLFFDPGNVIKIREPNGKIHVIDQNTVYSTDGAGNDTVQALYLDGNDIEIPIKLYYDHEVGYVVGHYAIPTYKTVTNNGKTFDLINGFGSRVEVGEEMNCYDYTYGDL
jgi:hypothetical protein